MQAPTKLRSILVASLIFGGVALYVSLDWLRNGEDERRQHSELAGVDQRGGNQDSPSAYALIPGSLMTGLCWRSDKGIREGLFKDVNEGIAFWREQAPASGSTHPSADDFAEMTQPDPAQLLRILRQLSFETTDVRPETGIVSGILTAGSRSEKVSLEMDRAYSNDFTSEQVLDIAVSSAIERYLPHQKLGYAEHDQVIELCIAFQAVG